MIKPKRDIVLIKVEKPPEKTASGFFLQEEWKTLPPIGVVEAVGPQVTDVQVGDKVIFERYASIILENDYRLCKESHLIGTIHD
jgi:co-chaperonin GroES (HSP10)